MNHKLDECASWWQLSRGDRARLARAVSSDRVESTCQDIDRALLWLLCDRQTIREWLRRPNPGLYHVSPLAVILGGRRGREMLRSQLLEEAAAVGDRAASLVAGLS